jgi:hypothetical protein
MAALGLMMSATAQAQQTKGEREAVAQDEVKRVEAMMTEVEERESELMLHHHTNPREIMEYCQQTLPKLDDAFRVLMMYAAPDLQPEFQRDYVEYRQNILNVFVMAQVALSTPSSGQ